MTERVERSELTSIAALALLGIALVARNWRRLLDPIIDSGRDLYIPEQLLEGAVLYRDIRYVYPPTTPYLLALFTAPTDHGLFAYALIGAFTAALAGAAVYAATRIAAGPVAATGATLLFVALNVTGGSTWGANFIFPYAHAATFGVTFLLFSIFFLCRALFVRMSTRSVVSAIVFAVLAASTKLEYALAAVILGATAFVVYRLQPRYLAVAAGAAAALFALFALAFGGAAPGHHWLWDNVYARGLLSGASSDLFYGRVSGTSDLATNLGGAALGALGFLAMTATLALLHRARSRAVAAILTLLFVALVYVSANDRFFAAWALLLPVVALIEIRKRTPLALLALVAIAVALRVYFLLGPWWYGFALVVPAYIVIAYVVFRLLPERNVYSPAVAKLWLVLFAVLAWRGIAYSEERLAARSYEVKSARGAFLDVPERGKALERLFARVAQQPSGQTLVAMPEGLGINYFTGRTTPIPHHMFTPIEIGTPEMERQIVARLRSTPPDLVVITSRDVTEFGYRGLGIDYGKSIVEELRRSYVPVARERGRWGWILLARRPGE